MRARFIPILNGRGILLAGAAATTAILISSLGAVINHTGVVLFLLLVTLFTLLVGEKLIWQAREVTFGIVVGGLIVQFIDIALVMINNITLPKEWDFLCFWLSGTVAAQKLNFYDPASYHGTTLPLIPNEEFVNEFMKVGFPYLPPAIFLYLPLGFFNYAPAYLLWYVVMLVTMLLCVLLLWRIYLPEARPAVLLLLLSLLLLLPPTHSTIEFGQTNFFVLLAILLVWRYRTSFAGGFALAFGLFVKPLVGVFLLFLFLRRHFRAFSGCVAGITVGMLVTAVIFGWETTTRYFETNVATALPRYVYIQSINKSLLSNILRATNYDLTSNVPIYNPGFLTCSVILLSVTAVLISKRSLVDEHLAFLSTYTVALLLYPATWQHYSVGLILPVLYIWKIRDRLIGGSISAAVYVAATYFLLTTYQGRYTFFANFLAWAVISGEALRQLAGSNDLKR